MEPTSVKVLIGRSTNISCKAVGVSAQVIKWYKRLETGDEEVFASRKTLNGLFVESVYVLDEAEINNGGKYYCTAGTNSKPSILTSKIATLQGLFFLRDLIED